MRSTLSFTPESFCHARQTQLRLVLPRFRAGFFISLRVLTGPIRESVSNYPSRETLDHPPSVGRFQNKLGVLCANTEQVIEMALNVACNEEDCLHVMQCLRYFAEWPPLEPYFRRKTDKVFNFVMDDIKTLTRLYSKNKYWVCSYTPDYSGAGVMATVYFRRITKIKKVSVVQKSLQRRIWGRGGGGRRDRGRSTAPRVICPTNYAS